MKPRIKDIWPSRRFDGAGSVSPLAPMRRNIVSSHSASRRVRSEPWKSPMRYPAPPTNCGANALGFGRRGRLELAQERRWPSVNGRCCFGLGPLAPRARGVLAAQEQSQKARREGGWRKEISSPVFICQESGRQVSAHRGRYALMAGTTPASAPKASTPSAPTT